MVARYVFVGYILLFNAWFLKAEKRRVSEWLNLMAFLGTLDSKVHISHVTIAYTLEPLSALT